MQSEKEDAGFIMAKEKAAAAAVEEQKEEKEVKDVHELSFVPEKGWGVKRQGSTKVIKYFKTKLEAVQYIIKVSENQKTRVVIHLKNGKFQKFDNAVRALQYAQKSSEEE